jgi:DNA-binding FadR family transcriptional regulator
MDTIGRRIVEGEWGEGAILPPEPELCAELGVSRTPLREAVKRLAAKGLIVVGPKSGTRVLPANRWNQLDGDVLRWRTDVGMSDGELEQLYELRLIFEPEASRLAAVRGSGEDHAVITAAMDDIERLRSHPTAVIAPDIAFHIAIIAATRNMFLISISDAIRTALAYQFEAGVKMRPFPADELLMHRHVCDAILARDGELAARLTRELICQSRDSLAKARRNARIRKAG